MGTSETQSKAPSVGKAWAWLLIFTGGMTIAAFIAWGTVMDGAPGWFHTLYAAQTIWAIVGVVNAHKRRIEWEAAQPPV